MPSPLGDRARADDVARSDGQLCPTPPPLFAGTVVPTLIKLATPGLF
jgi:hypothetical protein